VQGQKKIRKHVPKCKVIRGQETSTKHDAEITFTDEIPSMPPTEGKSPFGQSSEHDASVFDMGLDGEA